MSFTDQQRARANRRLDRAWSADESVALFVPDMWGSHDLKFGVQYLHAALRPQNWWNLNGTFTFSGNASFRHARGENHPDERASELVKIGDRLLFPHFNWQ